MRLDSTHIVLEKIRVMLNLLRKSNIFSESGQRENPLLTKFKDLQNFARHSTVEVLDPLEVVMPFLLILRAPNTTGPFKLAVLDALQTFMKCDVLHNCPAGNSGSSALNEMVDAIIKCKFVQSEVLSDELLQLQIVQTLHYVIDNPIRRFLTNAMAWQIIEFGMSILVNTGGVPKFLSLHQETERTVLDAICLVARCCARTKANTNQSSTTKGRADPLGFPCMLTSVAYLMNILKRRIDAHSGTVSTAIKTAPPPLSSKPSTGSLMDILHHDSETLHLIFALKALHAVAMVDGSSETFQQMLTGSIQFYRLIVESLSKHLFALAILRDAYPPIVLQQTLSLFGTLCGVVGPTLSICVECFCRDVYTKALCQIHDVFANEVVYHGTLDHIIAPHASSIESASSSSAPKTPGTPKTPGSSASSAPGYQLGATNVVTANFKVDELEIIIESLNDLLSEVSFVPSLFISFDCNISKKNLLHPIIQLISSCSRIVLNSGSEELGSFRHLGVLTIQSFKQLMRSFEHRRTLNEQYVAEKSSTGGNEATMTAASRNMATSVIDTKVATETTQRITLTKLRQYFKALRIAKSYFCEAAILFVQKPSSCFKFLQNCGAMYSEPVLLPRHVATFLRRTPALPKDAVGSYLGEMGKDGTDCHITDRQKFHADVLVQYVETFEFGGHSLLTCMRMFLSVFRLPGEAQQIDRILVAFSERCHMFANEGQSGVLENAEVTYLLCFSIIMLNTDRHNPNIRQDRKMTLEQFIRNNTNYGKDVNQTKPLPREFLEGIYKAISEEPIRTEPDDMSAIITFDMLLDLQLQSRAEFQSSVWISSGHDASYLDSLRPFLYDQHNEFNASTFRASVDLSKSITLPAIGGDGSDGDGDGGDDRNVHQLAIYIAKNLICASSDSSDVAPACPIDLCRAMSGLHWCVDSDLFECVYRDLLAVGMGVFLSNHSIMTSKLAIEKEVAELDHVTEELQTRHDALPRERTGRLLQLANDFLLDIIKLSSFYNIDHILDLCILLLIEFSGVLKCNASRVFFRSEPLNALRSLDDEEDCYEAILASVYAEIDEPSSFVYCLCYFASARQALSTLLQLIHNYHPSISNWSLVWHLFGALRDASLIPPNLVLESDSDSLPQNVRHEFELSLLQLDAKIINDTRPAQPINIPKKQSSSLLSLQGLGEALFGTGSATDVKDEESDAQAGSVITIDRLARANSSAGELILIAPNDSVDGARAAILSAAQKHHINPYNLPSARWDAGYEHDEISHTAAEALIPDEHSSTTEHGKLSKSHSSSFYDSKSSRHVQNHSNEGKSHAELRMLVTGTSFAQLFSDSKFLPEQNLVIFLQSLIDVTETKGNVRGASLGSSMLFGTIVEDVADGGGEDAVSRPASPRPVPTVLMPLQSRETFPLLDDAARRRSQVLALSGETRRQITSLQALSSSSASWLEMLLVELSLSNRDRFSLIWPLLRRHYAKVLGGQSVGLSYLTERRLVGLLKISTRMISREPYAEPVLELLGQLLTRSTAVSPPASPATAPTTPSGEATEGSQTQTALSLAAEIASAENAAALAGGIVPMRHELLIAFANQISSAVWRLLTLNVELLPLLPLGQWQSLFGIVAATATTGSFAAMKSFETMAWLLHEPRLIAKVPVFCIVSIKPLLRNQTAPLSVSIGAVHLLTHLHSRLEVLIKDEDATPISPECASSPALLADSGGLSNGDPRDDDYDDSDTPVLWESCWLPVLKALAEGADDPRISVRRACVVALCQCIQDKHIDAVPTSVLVDILGNVLSPLVLKLANILKLRLGELVPESALSISEPGEEEFAADTAAGKDGASSKISELSNKKTSTSTASNEHNPNVLVSALRRSASGRDSAVTRGPGIKPDHHVQAMQCDIAVCISAFHDLFLRHLLRLAIYPSFDRLWLRFLYIMGFFIGNVSNTPYGIDCRLLGLVERGAFPLDGSVPSLKAVVDLNEINELCRVTLQSLISRMKADSIFEIRDGLWFVSKETIKQFRHMADFDEPRDSK